MTAEKSVCFRSDLVKTQKSHQRKLVDGSDPTYKEIGFRNLRIPPTEVGGISEVHTVASRSQFSMDLVLLSRPKENIDSELIEPFVLQPL